MNNRFFITLVSFLLIMNTCFFQANAQGYNHNWLIGYDTGLVDTNVTSTKAWLLFDALTISVNPGNFKMPFISTQGNISDTNGNLLMVSNGCWIADATGDTMLNGGGLNPNQFTDDWCDNVTGLPLPHSNIVLPFPGDATKFVLFHQTGSYSVPNAKSLELYYSVVDLSLNGGLGGVINGQKNLIAIQDTLNPMLAVNKHANGRDWWIIAFEDNTDLVYKVLLSNTGISSVTTQSLGVTPNFYGLGQANFSPDGKKFAYHHRDFGPGGVPVYHTIRLFDFDRCSGNFSNTQIISYVDSVYSGNGLEFSSNSKYLYFTTFLRVYQINTDTTDVLASLQLVAENDTFYSPAPPYLTNFWMMYRAANGKIYIVSGNSVIDMHFINFPDSSGISCDVQQHAIHLPCYYFRGHVYHPNYYLGCDTTSSCPCLIIGTDEQDDHDFRFSISPNPNSGDFSIAYLLPQNKTGMFEIQDLNGKIVYQRVLPTWSTLQQIQLPVNIYSGVYNCSIISDNFRVHRKVALIR